MLAFLPRLYETKDISASSEVSPFSIILLTAKPLRPGSSFIEEPGPPDGNQARCLPRIFDVKNSLFKCVHLQLLGLLGYGENKQDSLMQGDGWKGRVGVKELHSDSLPFYCLHHTQTMYTFLRKKLNRTSYFSRRIFPSVQGNVPLQVTVLRSFLNCIIRTYL